MSDSAVYSILNTPEDFERATDLEIEVWGLSPRDALPPNLLTAVTHNSGVLVGASIDDRLIGIAFGFMSERNGHKVLWSHLTGVLKAYQGRGIGEGLKYAQRQWASEHNYDQIRWTFDPLQRGNANFNLSRLGTTADTYHINLYGVMNDAINAGIPSDRIEACWDLRRPPPALPLVDASTPIALCIDQDGSPITHTVSGAETFLAEIPENLAAMKATSGNLALAWRLALREILLNAFQQGYIAVGFVSVIHRQTQAYLLTKLRG